MPTNGRGRGDGDEGSDINYHIGYLENDDNSTIKPYIRTGDPGKRVVPKKKVIYDVHRYFLRRATKFENEFLEQAEKDFEGWKNGLPAKNLYIKIAEVKGGGGRRDKGDLKELGEDGNPKETI